MLENQCLHFCPQTERPSATRILQLSSPSIPPLSGDEAKPVCKLSG